jgi:signal transduction histidine kinase
MRLPIARSFRLALIGLTIVLAIVAAAGVVSLVRARQHYESALTHTSRVATAVADLTSAGIAETVVLRQASATGNPAARQAIQRFDRAAAVATSLARPDPLSARLVAAQIAQQVLVRRLVAGGRLRTATAIGGPLQRMVGIAAALQSRQQSLERAAAGSARSKSRRAIAVVIVAGLLALLGVLALGAAFNAMGANLVDAQVRIEAERRRLAVTIESLGDALLVTEPGSSAIATINPRASELMPELGVGDRVDGAGSPLPPLPIALEKESVIHHGGRTLAVTAAPLGSEADGVVWTVRDVTERARLEQAKTEFVATASHELRSPLTSIKGFIELLDRAPENMSDRQREFIDIILRSTDRLVELVDDLLDVASFESDSVEITRRPIDLGEAVREIAELMGPRIAEKHQRLGIYVAPALPLALGDPRRIRQIIANLMTNAHMYTDEGGRIHIGVEADRAWVRIVVADSGIGLTQEEREHVFERFYRVHGAEAAIPGTGLGLSIVKALVELHEGEIEVDSEPGRGTTFHVFIPAAIAGRDAGQAREVIRGRRVLIVDDEPEVAELIARHLEPLEVRAMIATSGEQAMQQLRTQRIDAITLDITMPGMDGFEVVRRIRADPELRAIPILFVSEFAGRRELAGEWAVGKPIDADELRDVLAAAIRAGRSRVLVVGRHVLQPTLEPALDELGIEHQWETSGAAAARVCGERRFEVALIDVGIRNPGAAVQALDLRGRRLRRAVILFSDGDTPTPSGIVKLGIEVVGLQDAAQALLAALRGDRV